MKKYDYGNNDSTAKLSLAVVVLKFPKPHSVKFRLNFTGFFCDRNRGDFWDGWDGDIDN